MRLGSPQCGEVKADMDRSCCKLKATSHATRLSMIISREAEKHLGDASREDSRPAPAIGLHRCQCCSDVATLFKGVNVLS